MLNIASSAINLYAEWMKNGGKDIEELATNCSWVRK